MKKDQKIILVDAYHCLFTDSGINKEIQKVLDGFSDMQKIILTNASGEKLDFLEKHKPKNYKLFTLKGNPRKTDGGYYEKMLKHFRIKAKNCIYIEHNEVAVQKARFSGIDSSLFEKDNDIEQNIKILLITEKYSTYFAKRNYLTSEVYKLYENGNYINYIITLTILLEMQLNMIISSSNELCKTISKNNNIYIPEINTNLFGKKINNYKKISSYLGKELKKDITLLELISSKRNNILHNNQAEKSFFDIGNEIKKNITLRKVTNLIENIDKVKISVDNVLINFLEEKIDQLK